MCTDPVTKQGNVSQNKACVVRKNKHLRVQTAVGIIPRSWRNGLGTHHSGVRWTTLKCWVPSPTELCAALLVDYITLSYNYITLSYAYLSVSLPDRELLGDYDGVQIMFKVDIQ